MVRVVGLALAKLQIIGVIPNLNERVKRKAQVEKKSIHCKPLKEKTVDRTTAV